MADSIVYRFKNCLNSTTPPQDVFVYVKLSLGSPVPTIGNIISFTGGTPVGGGTGHPVGYWKFEGVEFIEVTQYEDCTWHHQGTDDCTDFWTPIHTFTSCNGTEVIQGIGDIEDGINMPPLNGDYPLVPGNVYCLEDRNGSLSCCWRYDGDDIPFDFDGTSYINVVVTEDENCQCTACIPYVKLEHCFTGVISYMYWSDMPIDESNVYMFTFDQESCYTVKRDAGACSIDIIGPYGDADIVQTLPQCEACLPVHKFQLCPTYDYTGNPLSLPIVLAAFPYGTTAPTVNAIGIPSFEPAEACWKYLGISPTGSSTEFDITFNLLGQNDCTVCFPGFYQFRDCRNSDHIITVTSITIDATPLVIGNIYILEESNGTSLDCWEYIGPTTYPGHLDYENINSTSEVQCDNCGLCLLKYRITKCDSAETTIIYWNDANGLLLTDGTGYQFNFIEGDYCWTAELLPSDCPASPPNVNNYNQVTEVFNDCAACTPPCYFFKPCNTIPTPGPPITYIIGHIDPASVDINDYAIGDLFMINGICWIYRGEIYCVGGDPELFLTEIDCHDCSMCRGFYKLINCETGAWLPIDWEGPALDLNATYTFDFIEGCFTIDTITNTCMTPYPELYNASNIIDTFINCIDCGGLCYKFIACDDINNIQIIQVNSSAATLTTSDIGNVYILSAMGTTCFKFDGEVVCNEPLINITFTDLHCNNCSVCNSKYNITNCVTNVTSTIDWDAVNGALLTDGTTYEFDFIQGCFTASIASGECTQVTPYTYNNVVNAYTNCEFCAPPCYRFIQCGTNTEITVQTPAGVNFDNLILSNVYGLSAQGSPIEGCFIFAGEIICPSHNQYTDVSMTLDYHCNNCSICKSRILLTNCLDPLDTHIIYWAGSLITDTQFVYVFDFLSLDECYSATPLASFCETIDNGIVYNDNNITDSFNNCVLCHKPCYVLEHCLNEIPTVCVEDDLLALIDRTINATIEFDGNVYENECFKIIEISCNACLNTAIILNTNNVYRNCEECVPPPPPPPPCEPNTVC